MLIRPSEGINPYIYVTRQISRSPGKEGHFCDNSLIKCWHHALQLALPFGNYLTVFVKSKYQLAVESKLSRTELKYAVGLSGEIIIS